MALENHSAFYYIEPVSDTNFYLPFIEPNDANIEINAEVDVGKYSITDLAAKVEDAMNSFGALTYQVEFNRITRKIEISANGDFELLIGSGITVGVDIFPLLGFNTAVDSGVVTEIESTVEIGTEFIPQFWLQSYVDPRFKRKAISGVQSVSANGQVETVTFGRASFLEFEIKFQNNTGITGVGFTGTSSGIEALESFLNFIIDKSPIEFMVSVDDRSVFQKIILESTQEDSTGLGFLMSEMVGSKLADLYESGKLVFRILE